MDLDTNQNDSLSLLDLLRAVRQKVQTEPMNNGEMTQVTMLIADLFRMHTASPLLNVHDTQDIRGQLPALRALAVAAAGAHNILLVGPPDAGKSFLVSAFPGILPAFCDSTPLCAPRDHTDLMGTLYRPGDLVLAHGGVLVLEDLPRFPVSVLQAVSKVVRSRVAVVQRASFPAHFQLVGTMRPCPCGFYGDPLIECGCTSAQIIMHTRHCAAVASCFAMTMPIERITDDVFDLRPGDTSDSIRQHVEEARVRQKERYRDTTDLTVNADLRTVEQVAHYCTLEKSAKILLEAARRQLRLSPAAIIQLLAVALTIADLAREDVIKQSHVAEAIQYRPRF